LTSARGGIVALGQFQRLAAVEGQVPAPVADPSRRLDLRAQRGRGGEQVIVGLLLFIGVIADHQRQIGHLIGLDRLILFSPRPALMAPVSFVDTMLRPLGSLLVPRFATASRFLQYASEMAPKRHQARAVSTA
jgi:hypothetical protein